MPAISPNKKILIVPDKFKGSLTAPQVAEAIAQGIRKSRAYGKELPELLQRPMADGGDGSMEVMEAALSAAGIPCRKLTAGVSSLLGEPIQAPYLIIGEHQKTAFIEMAKVCGLSQIPPEKRDPVNFTTRPLGELMRYAAEHHSLNKTVIAIGGSATNDGGCGLIAALPPHFLCKIEVACDVTNPLLGPNGATYVYGPQKFRPDISEEELKNSLKLLEERMTLWAQSLPLKDWRKEAAYPGAGAAGGVGFALHTLLEARLTPGWKLFSDILNLEKEITQADLVITGEGRFDSQSLSGKLPYGIAQMCRKHHKPLWLICGESKLKKEEWLKVGITRVTPLTELNPDTDYCIKNAEKLIIEILRQ